MTHAESTLSVESVESVESAVPMVVPFPMERVDDAWQTLARSLREYLLVQERAYSADHWCALDRLVDASNNLGEALDQLAGTLPPGC